MCIIAHVHVHLRADQTNTYIPICMRRSVHLEPWKKQPQFSNHHILFTDSGSSTARRPPQSCRNLGCTCDAKPAHFFVIGGFLVDGSLSLSVSLFPLLSVCLPHLEVAHWPSLRHPCMCECTCELQGAKCSITYHETFRKISQMQMCKAQVICFLALCARPSNLYCTL